MNALRSLCAKNVQTKLHSQLKLICGRDRIPSVNYATDLPEIADEGEATETPKEPTGLSLPGRKHVYEPGYLDKLKPAIPLHGLVNICMKGYDFAVLESLQKIVCKLLSSAEINVADGWAVRAESWHIQRYEPNSSTAQAEFNMKEYQRVLQLVDLPSTKMGLVIELLQGVTPPGVTCSVMHHTKELEKLRYIPDMGLMALQDELEELGGPSKLMLKRQKDAAFRKL